MYIHVVVQHHASKLQCHDCISIFNCDPNAHFMQEFLRRETKPKIKDELVNGILQFWTTVTAAKCQRYISHLNKVIPEMIKVQGEATGF